MVYKMTRMRVFLINFFTVKLNNVKITRTFEMFAEFV